MGKDQNINIQYSCTLQLDMWLVLIHINIKDESIVARRITRVLDDSINKTSKSHV